LDAACSWQWEFIRNFDRKFQAAAVGNTSRSWAYLHTLLFTKEVICPPAAYVVANTRPAVRLDRHLAVGLDRPPAHERSKPESANMESRGRGGEVQVNVC